MRLLTLALLLVATHAHMPSFPVGGSVVIGDIFDKSWGVYVNLVEDQQFAFQCEEGKTLSLSLSKPVGTAGDVVGTIEGLNVVCEQGFNGWGSRRLLQLPPVAQSTHFEPFGVGGYVSLAACQTTCPDSKGYKLRVEGPVGMPLSVGAGMTESFSLGELASMSFLLFRSFQWSGQDPAWVWGAAMGTLLVSGLCTLCRNLCAIGRLWKLLTLCAIIMLRTSASIFSFQLIYLATHLVPMGGKVGIPLTIHIGIPLVLAFFLECYVVRRQARGGCVRVLLLVLSFYCALFCWQGYTIPAIALFAAAAVPEGPGYSLVVNPEKCDRLDV